MQYPAKFAAEDGGGYSVTFRDIPEAITQGETIEEARAMAVDALVTAMDFYLEDGRRVPGASAAKRGEELVSLPASVVSKVLLLNAMVDKRMRPADLARAMGVKPQEVNRITNLHHATKIDTLEQAFKAMGLQLQLSVG